jgi:hypothetical protein
MISKGKRKIEPNPNKKRLRTSNRSHLLKGQSPLLSHTLVVGFSVFLVLAVVTTLNVLKSDYQDFIAKGEIEQVCALIRNGIDSIYNPDDYISPTDTTMGRITILLPDKLAGNVYRIRLVNSSSYIETVSQPAINRTCRLGFPAVYNGSTSGGETEITWTRYSNGNDRIDMRKI